MVTVILVIHLLIAIAMVGVILMQRSEGGALGIGGSGGGLMSGRQAGNLLTRTTAILAAAFMSTSMILAILANNASAPRKSILEQAAPAVPVEAAPPVPLAAPAKPDSAPSAPAPDALPLPK